MTDWWRHYKEVRARLNQQPQITKIKPPKHVDDYVMPVCVPEVSETAEQLQKKRLKGCPLSMRRQAIVLPVLEEFDMTWEQLWEKDRTAKMHPPRRKVWLKLWEDGMSMNQIAYYTRRDHTTVLWGLRMIKKEQSKEKVECTTGTR
jgi:chromosomal replication initiation ATPase DnaA